MNPVDEEIVQELLERIEKNESLQRKHANFRNYFCKNTKETGLFFEVFKRIEKELGSKIANWGLVDNDPPDIFAELKDGRKIGIEITELVNEAAITAQIQRSANYFKEQLRFNVPTACDEISKIVARKSKKSMQAREDYNEILLLIHTDEMLLTSDNFIAESNEVLDIPENIFQSVYLLFSYEPKNGKSPLLKIANGGVDYVAGSD